MTDVNASESREERMVREAFCHLSSKERLTRYNVVSGGQLVPCLNVETGYSGGSLKTKKKGRRDAIEQPDVSGNEERLTT